MRVPAYDRRQVLPEPVAARVPGAAPDLGTVTLADGVSTVTAEMANVAAKAQREQYAADVADTGLELARLRNRARERFRAKQAEAPLGAPDFTADFVRELDSEGRVFVDSRPGVRLREYARRQFEELRGQFVEDGQQFEAVARRERVATELEATTNESAVLLHQQPDRFEGLEAEARKYLEVAGLTESERVAREADARSILAGAAVLGLIKQRPAEALAALRAAPGESGVAAVEALPADRRIRLTALAETGVEDAVAGTILSTWRADARAGTRELAGLDARTDVDPAVRDGIRRKVLSGVDALRGERQLEHADDLAAVERGIATGGDLRRTTLDIERLYRRGALTPLQLANLSERALTTARKAAEEGAAVQAFTTAIGAGVPIDLQDADQRKLLDRAFGADVRGQAPGSPTWQATALSYAGRARLLPPSAASWLRTAARSPTPALVTAAAEFYGSVEQQSPEAAGSLDTDTKAILGGMGAMLAAGAEPQAAFETVRANVLETRPEVRQARETAYRAAVKSSPSALSGLIGREFGGLFSTPAASTALRHDFDRQAGEYFTKVGDLELARELAWRDLRRVYGPSRVNGDASVMAFPPERFGLTPEEVRADVAAFLQASGSKLDPATVLVVPDAITLRMVDDALTGEPVMPSYRLVTAEGELVTRPDGLPVRYAVPTSGELTARVAAAQERARAEAEESIARARRLRDLIETAEANPLDDYPGL